MFIIIAKETERSCSFSNSLSVTIAGNTSGGASISFNGNINIPFGIGNCNFSGYLSSSGSFSLTGTGELLGLKFVGVNVASITLAMTLTNSELGFDATASIAGADVSAGCTLDWGTPKIRICVPVPLLPDACVNVGLNGKQM